MANPLNPFMSGVQNLYTDVTGALMGADLQGALANPMFLYGASILGRGQTRAPQPLFDMQTFAQAQQMADMYKRRKFFSDLAEEQQKYEGQLDRFQDFATNVGEVARDYETEYTGTQEDILEEYTPDDAYEGVTAGFPLDPSDIDTAAYRERLLDEGVQLAPTGGSPEMVDAEIGVRGTEARLPIAGDFPAALAVDPVSGEVMTPAPELMADPLSRENLTNRLLQSGVPALQQAGLQEKFKPPSLMAVDPWTNLYDTRTGKFVSMGGAGGAGAGMFDPRFMSKGFKSAFSLYGPEGIGTDEFKRHQQEVDLLQERAGPAGLPKKLRELRNSLESGVITQKGYNNQVKMLLKAGFKENLTEAENQTDKEMAKQFTSWGTKGGRFQDISDIDQIDQVIQAMMDGKDLTGNFLTRMLPQPLEAVMSKDKVMAEQDILSIVQRNLRAILGAQFTENEAKRIMERAWDPALGQDVLLKRAKRMVGVLKAKQSELNRAYAYWRKEELDIDNLFIKPARSMVGYEQQDFMTADDFLKTIAIDQPQSGISGRLVP